LVLRLATRLANFRRRGKITAKFEENTWSVLLCHVGSFTKGRNPNCIFLKTGTKKSEGKELDDDSAKEKNWWIRRKGTRKIDTLDDFFPNLRSERETASEERRERPSG